MSTSLSHVREPGRGREQEAVRRGEDGRIGADANRQRQDCGDRERWCSQEETKRLSNVAEKPHGSSSLVTRRNHNG